MLPNNMLNNAEAERLAVLVEELGEVQQMVGKILRHGYESVHPEGGPTNRSRLEAELGDLYNAVTMLTDAGDLGTQEIYSHSLAKSQTIGPWLYHQEEQHG